MFCNHAIGARCMLLPSSVCLLCKVARSDVAASGTLLLTSILLASEQTASVIALFAAALATGAMRWNLA